MTHRRLLPLVVLVLLATRTASAERLDAKERRARTACLAGDPTQGVQLLSELFVATKDPTFIYNQGRCFEQNRRYEDAIARFQEFLRASKRLTKADKDDALKHIEDCKELLASDRSQSPPATPVLPSALPTEPIPSPPVAAVSVAPASQLHVSQSDRPDSRLRPAGVIAASVGGAALVTAIVFNLLANSLANDMKKTDHYSTEKDSDRKTYRTLGWIGYGVGTASLATGALLYALGLRAITSDEIAIVPSFAPDSAAAVLEGKF